jgi:hypothetical protein
MFLHNICACNFYSCLNYFVMPGRDNDYRTGTDKPEADKASKQNAHIDRNEDMGDIDPEYRNEVDKLYEKT